MKNLILLMLVGMLSLAARAQSDKPVAQRTITVNGSAELELVPDEIYVQVDLREYEKRGSGKIQLDQVRREFLAAVKAAGIADSLVTIATYGGHQNPWWNKKNKKNELYASVSYQLKLKSSRQIDDLVERLDEHATQNFYIQRTSHSRLQEYRRQLKIQAVKAAKEKARYLAEAIDETIGDAVTINEPNEYYTPYYPPMVRSNVMMKEGMDAGVAAPEEAVVDFRKIRLKYDVTVVFALK
ncbi:MAG TPA: SIMPL domain-containing protein [Flavisolibacter sp.]